MAPVKWMAAEVLAERKYSHYSDVVRNTATHSGIWFIRVETLSKDNPETRAPPPQERYLH